MFGFTANVTKSFTMTAHRNHLPTYIEIYRDNMENLWSFKMGFSVNENTVLDVRFVFT